MEDNQQQDTGVQTADAVDSAMNDDAEWGKAFEKNYGPDFNKQKKDEEDDAGKGDDDSADKGTDDDASKGSEDDEKKKSEEASADDDSAQDKVDPYATQRDARQVQRELEADTRAMRDDIRKELYSDLQTELTDADGDPIRTPADVMKLLNPNTQKPFTEEEAVQYLFAAQKHLDKELATAEKEIERVADIQIMIRDETDNIRAKFGEILTKMPELRKEIWADYKATLKLDPKTSVIIDAPISLERFFERALQPYAEYAETLKSQQAQTAETKKAEVQQRKQTQADRQDITSGGKGDVTDPEDEEWNKAFKKQYGN